MYLYMDVYVYVYTCSVGIFRVHELGLESESSSLGQLMLWKSAYLYVIISLHFSLSWCFLIG